MKFLNLTTVWKSYHRWFPKDQACVQVLPAGTQLNINGQPFPTKASIKLDTGWIRSILRKDLKPTMAATLPDYSCTMVVRPADQRGVVYYFLLN